MISSNIGEVASIFISAALGLPEGLIPVQLLWVNLVTDGPPATALGFNPPDPDIMTKKPRRASDHFITPWILLRWMVVGIYVGVATVGVFATWYTRSSFLGIDLSADGHTPVTLAQLRDWEACPSWAGFSAAPYTAGARVVGWENPCDYFTVGKAKASTLSLSVLVAIEMFNAANALSEDNSLLQVPVWANPYLLLAMAGERWGWGGPRETGPGVGAPGSEQGLVLAWLARAPRGICRHVRAGTLAASTPAQSLSAPPACAPTLPAVSFGLHFVILYVPFLASIFSIVPLSLNEWLLVLAYSLPVVLIDEVLKFIVSRAGWWQAGIPVPTPTAAQQGVKRQVHTDTTKRWEGTPVTPHPQ